MIFSVKEMFLTYLNFYPSAANDSFLLLLYGFQLFFPYKFFLFLDFLNDFQKINMYDSFYPSHSEFTYSLYSIHSMFSSFPIFFFFGCLFFLSTMLSFFFISYLGLYGVFKYNIITLAFFWLSVLLHFNNAVLDNQVLLIKVGKWFYIFHNYQVNLEFYIDSLSISYMLLTLTISYFVQLYTFAYFRYEPLVERLILFLNTFILSMIFFVSSSNLILLFLGWELIGLTSFALINFWVTRKATLKSAFKAFVFNKISDIFFFIFIILVLFLFNSLDIIVINKQAHLMQLSTISILNLDFSLIELLCFFLTGAAFIKSAQFGFHLWLPDSMEAPVPASALIHSATLVSAGLFLLIRFYPLFELTNYIIYLIVLISALTSFYGGLAAMFQSDTKRILAYSTISHCGFLIVSFFFFSSEITLFYLYVHGFFKAGVFLCVGNLIRFNSNYQDFRRMGGLYKYLPSDSTFMLLGLFNLGGLPFSLGFYMKHNLLLIIQQNTMFNSLIFSFCILGALTGLFYSYKLLTNTMFDFKKAKKFIYSRYNRLLLIDDINQNKRAYFDLNLKSYFYKNSFDSFFYINSKDAVLSIKFLFIMSYIICFWFFWIMKTNVLSVDFTIFSNCSFLDIIFENLLFLWTLTFINWVILFLIIAITFSCWRNSNNNLYKYNLFFIIIAFFCFFLI